MLCVGIGALGLLTHVIYLKRQYRQAVECPRRAFGVDCGLGEHFHLGKMRAKVGVELLHKVGTLLVTAVDAAFYRQCGHRVYIRIANNVLKVPLNGVDPVLSEQLMLNCSILVGIGHHGIHVVGNMIRSYCFLKNLVTIVNKIPHPSLFASRYTTASNNSF